MKNAAVLVLALVVCLCNPGWAKMEYQPQCSPTVFDVVLDIVTAPCSLLGACLGLDESSRCVPPAKVKKVIVGKKCVETSSPVEHPQKPKTKAPVEKTEKETPRQSAAVPTPQAQQPVPVAPVPMEQFTASEKSVVQPVPREESSRPTTEKKELPPEQPQPVTATMPTPVPAPMDDPRPVSVEKPVAEIVQPKAGTVADVPERLPAPQISPPKVEQKSTQDAQEGPQKPMSQTKAKKSSGYGGCYPSVPYFQTYPSCGPRFFLR